MWARSFEFADFRLLWVCVLLQSTAMGMNWVVTGWLVFDVTDSPFLVGVSSALAMAPFFFLGLVSGAVADRMDRGRLLRIVTLAAAVASAALGVVLVLELAELWHILALTAVGGCVSAFMMTTRQSLTYDIVGPSLALNGMSLNSVSMQVGSIVGSLLSGFIIAVWGGGGQFLVIGVVYLASGVSLLYIQSPSANLRARSREPVLRNLVGYASIMRQNRVLVTLMALAGVTELFGFTHMSLLPVIAKDVLGLGAVGLGVMTAVRQVGGIGGLIGLSAMGDFRHKGFLMFIIMGAFGGSLMSLVLNENVIYYVAVLTLSTTCAMCVDTLYMTLMQENVPDEQRGRAMGAWTLSIGVAPVGHLGLGALTGIVGAPRALLASGSALLGVAVATALGLPSIRRLP